MKYNGVTGQCEIKCDKCKVFMSSLQSRLLFIYSNVKKRFKHFSFLFICKYGGVLTIPCLNINIYMCLDTLRLLLCLHNDLTRHKSTRTQFNAMSLCFPLTWVKCR